jgi:hypothetical protein
VDAIESTSDAAVGKMGIVHQSARQHGRIANRVLQKFNNADLSAFWVLGWWSEVLPRP